MGIVHEYTNPYTPEQNGVSERYNRTIMEATRTMLLHARLPLFFWAEAVNSAVYVRNCSPTTSLPGKTTYECWFGKKPDLSNLRVFGCVSYVHIPSQLRKKLDQKSEKSIFIEYPDGTKGYKLYSLKSKKFLRSKTVLFHEDEFHNFDLDMTQEKLCTFPNIDDDELILNNNKSDENIIDVNEVAEVNEPNTYGETQLERHMKRNILMKH